MSLPIYLIYPDNVGELREIEGDLQRIPSKVTATVGKRIGGDVKMERFAAPLIGYRWVGKVQRFAFVYDARSPSEEEPA